MAGSVEVTSVRVHDNNPSDGTVWYYAACASCGWSTEWSLSFHTTRHDQLAHGRKCGSFPAILKAPNVGGHRPARHDVPAVRAPKVNDVHYYWSCGRCVSRSKLYAGQGVAWQHGNGHHRQTGHQVEVYRQDRRTDRWVTELCGAPISGERQEVLF